MIGVVLGEVVEANPRLEVHSFVKQVRSKIEAISRYESRDIEDIAILDNLLI